MKKYLILIILYFIIINSPFSQEQKQDESKTETTINEKSKSENSAGNEVKKEPEKEEKTSNDVNPEEKEEPKPVSSPNRPIRISFFFDTLTAEKQFSDSFAAGAGLFRGNNLFYRSYKNTYTYAFDPINSRFALTENYFREKSYPDKYIYLKWFPFKNNFFLNFQIGIADNGKSELNDIFTRSAAKSYFSGNLYTVEYKRSLFAGINAGYRVDFDRFFIGFEAGLGFKRKVANRVDLVYGAEDAGAPVAISDKAADYLLHKAYYSQKYKDSNSLFPIYYIYAGVSF